AVRIAVASAVTVPAVAVNVAVVLLAATVTDAGTVNEPLLSDSVTVPPPVFDNVTVHVLLAPLPKVPGAQLTDVTVIAATSPIDVVCEDPFNVAVIVAVASAAIVPAVAVNVA